MVGKKRTRWKENRICGLNEAVYTERSQILLLLLLAQYFAFWMTYLVQGDSLEMGIHHA